MLVELGGQNCSIPVQMEFTGCRVGRDGHSEKLAEYHIFPQSDPATISTLLNKLKDCL